MVASALASTAVTVPAYAADHCTRPDTDTPLVIGHRGAPGYRPEHTLASYRLAIDMGADYIEPDLVSTKDGVLVARHENEISGTTDVADRPEFADRRTTKTIECKQVIGWFTEDFTPDELKTLRAKERLPQVRPGNSRYDGKFEVPTFEEVLDLAAQESKRRGVTIGDYPETKHPSYFDSIGLSLDEPLAAALRRHHPDRPDAPVFVQSFEEGNLQVLHREVKVPLVRLVDAGQQDLVTPAGLRHIATYADAVGANTELVLPRDGDGVFSDCSDTAVEARREWEDERAEPAA